MSYQRSKSDYKNVIFQSKLKRIIYLGGFQKTAKNGTGIEFSSNCVAYYGQILYNQQLFEKQIMDLLYIEVEYRNKIQVKENGSLKQKHDKYIKQNKKNSRPKIARVKYWTGRVDEGEFLNEKHHGCGMMKLGQGQIFWGNWTNGYLFGYGKLLIPHGLIYIGEINYESQRHGFGVWKWSLYDQDDDWYGEKCTKNETRYEGFGIMTNGRDMANSASRVKYHMKDTLKMVFIMAMEFNTGKMVKFEKVDGKMVSSLKK